MQPQEPLLDGTKTTARFTDFIGLHQIILLTLLVSLACDAIFIIDSGETVKKKP